MAGNAKTAINPDTKAVLMVFFMAGFLSDFTVGVADFTVGVEWMKAILGGEA